MGRFSVDTDFCLMCTKLLFKKKVRVSRDYEKYKNTRKEKCQEKDSDLVRLSQIGAKREISFKNDNEQHNDGAVSRNEDGGSWQASLLG